MAKFKSKLSYRERMKRYPGVAAKDGLATTMAFAPGALAAFLPVTAGGIVLVSAATSMLISSIAKDRQRKRLEEADEMDGTGIQGLGESEKLSDADRELNEAAALEEAQETGNYVPDNSHPVYDPEETRNQEADGQTAGAEEENAPAVQSQGIG